MKPEQFTRVAGAVLAVALVGTLVAPAFAVDYRLGALRIKDPWARATTSRWQAGRAFMLIENTGDTPDRLVAVTCTDARAAHFASRRCATYPASTPRKRFP